MKQEFPGAVPEIPVKNVDAAAAYYKNQPSLGLDSGGETVESLPGADCFRSRVKAVEVA